MSPLFCIQRYELSSQSHTYVICKTVSIRAIDSEKDMIESKQFVSFSFDPQSVKEDDGLELRVLLVHENKDLNFTPNILLLSKNKQVDNEDIREHVKLRTENDVLKIGAEYHMVRCFSSFVCFSLFTSLFHTYTHTYAGT